MTNSTDIRDRLSKTWPWFKAVYAFDYADPAPLCELIRTEPIPPEYLDAVADIVAGKRQPNRRAAAKFKKSLPATKRMQIASSLNFIFGIRDFLKSSPQHTENVASEQRIEPQENIQFLNDEFRTEFEKSAKSYGVSTETLENLLREFRERIARWPVV
jgi:hypothetical protein